MSESAGPTFTSVPLDKPFEQGGERKNLEPAGKQLYTKRRIARFDQRATVFAAADDGTAERVYLVGRPPPQRELLAMAGDGEIYLDGHYPVIKRDGRQITWAGSWFGDGGDYTAADCADVWETLARLVAHEWRGQAVTLLATPATTGRDLWVRTVPAGDGYPVQTRALQSAIRSNAGQGRIQTMPGAGIVRLYEYDARLAYLSVTRRMPVGYPVELVDGDAAEWVERRPYQPARVQLSFRPPAGWGPIGIIPVKVGGGAGDAWTWPTEHAWHGPTWCESSELFVANRHGWETRIHSVIGWEKTGNVFAVWQRRLLNVLAAGQQHYVGHPVRAAMVRAAVRSLALHAIGAMHGAPHKVTHVGTDPTPDARALRMIEGGRMIWHTSREPAWPQLSHPEWTATIWGRWRARLLDGPAATGALHVPRGQVAAFRTDAIYTTAPTEWADADDGAAGRYRLKTVTRPVPWPRNGTDVLAAKAAAL